MLVGEQREGPLFLITVRRLERTPEATAELRVLNVLAVESLYFQKGANVSRLEGNAMPVCVCVYVSNSYLEGAKMQPHSSCRHARTHTHTKSVWISEQVT